ncbi:putative Na+/H+ antiporter [Leeia sp. TBRC 13508]|uniref:Na+/H+ antiporter n=1 Tax=Leeia speluncae TaxID=2884804 RepID=A0ABS8D6X3_9NEIS|nr:putative Na+/H+ antiporter [Leeia speluncae]MCB6183954.1 putative Na+/H+ antiporter [Leeia speluncae]
MEISSNIQLIGTIIFGIAILHTFSTGFFEHLAHKNPANAGLWHLLGEVEVVFGFWAMVLMLAIFFVAGEETAIHYIDGRNFTEPLFVFAIMVIAGTSPILTSVMKVVNVLGKASRLPGSLGQYFLIMSLVPLAGSFITEPAAMTLAAIMLSEKIFQHNISNKLKYATIGCLFVNISIGGTLTSFAAPPVLMVAGAWKWDSNFMLTTIGWKAAIAIGINTVLLCAIFFKELRQLTPSSDANQAKRIPLPLVIVHYLFLAGVVIFSHHPAIFLGLFLFFLGLAQAYEKYHQRLILKEGLLVAFFLAGLVVLGGLQEWWLKPVLVAMTSDQVFWGATILTAFTDNAALTYLGSLVDNLSPEFKYALVTGAVTGGGLTIIANAPNPAGVAILKNYFEESSIKPLKLAAAAAIPTLISATCFLML